jgi:prepilin-type N-terminal cleavage/methylation domain-containing protein
MKAQLHIFSTQLKSQKGFTLIETMIGLAIFTVGIFAVWMMSSTAIRGYSDARSSTVEVNRTSVSIETLKQTGFTNDDIFDTDQSTYMPAQGVDGTYVGYSFADNVAVRGTKMIITQNNQIKGFGPGNNFALFYTKSLIQ